MMRKYHNDNSYATHPGRLTLSDAKLRELEPALFEPRTFKCGPLCPVDHPTHELRERYAEHLQIGASEPAIVMSTVPLILAVQAGDIDAAVLVRYPTWLVPRHRLVVGSRLLVVNTYADVHGTMTGEVWYAVDLIPGPDRERWSDIFPLVADFLSDDVERIAARKREIPESDWTRLEENARRRIDRWGLGTARDGRPTRVRWPVRIRGFEYFQSFDSFSATPMPYRQRLAIAVAAVVTFAIALIVLLRSLT